MNSSFFRKVSIGSVALGVGIFLIPAIFVLAQTQTVDNQAAFDDLGKLTGQEVTRLEQAKAICNVEQYITECAEIGKKYGLYTADEQKQVNSVLLELKGKIVEDLKNCSTEECLVNVANQLAKSFASRNPALGRQLDLTTAKVEEKRIIVETAKEIGVTVDQCRTMDPDTAPIELLRSCARLAKDSRVQKYIPEDARRLAEASDTSLDLQEALRKGEYQCGDNTLDGCGNFCLNPSQGTQTSDASAIPQVCRQIAVKFFGQDGVKQLESAYTKVNSASDYYRKKAEAVTFKTQDGRVLTSPVEIGRYMEGEMKNGNVEAIQSGMDFMVTRGFVTSADRDFAVKMAQKAREQGSNFDFNNCEKDPKSCQNFIPDDQREEFGAMEEIHRIMSEEMRKLGVPSPESCENPQYGDACIKAARAALPQIEEIAKNFAPARGIVEDIRRHISFSDGASDARKRAEEEFKKEGGEINIGDQKFRNFGDMETFCRSNGSLCLTEAAKKGFINKDYASSRYENTFGSQRSTAGGVFPPGQTPGFTIPGPGFGAQPGFNKEEALKQFQQWLDNPVGAPPIPGGGFPGGPQYPQGSQYQTGGPYPQQFGDPLHQQSSFCPAYSPMPPCPTGQYRPESRDERGCFSSGACISITQTVPYQQSCLQGQYWNGSTCVNSDVRPDSCPTGQYWFVPYGGGSGYCKPNEQPTPTTGVCSQELINILGSGCHSMDNAFFDSAMTKYVFPGATSVNECSANYIRNCTVGFTNNGQTCPSGQYWNGTACVTSTTTTENDCYTRYGAGWHTMDASSGTCFNPTMTEYRATNGTLYQCSVTPTTGCSGTTTTTTTCSSGQYWNGTTCVASTATTTTTTACPSGQYWSGTACVINPSPTTTTCPSGQTWNGTYCVSSTTTSSYCPSFAHEMSGYCMLNNDTTRCAEYPSASTEGNYTAAICQQHTGTTSTTTTTTCPSGQYWYVPSGGGAGYCKTTSTTDCPSGQYWSGTACVISPSSTSCSSGQYWDGNACVTSTTTTTTTACNNNNVCDSGESSGSCPSDCSSTTNTTSTTCGSGQYWDGNACVTSTTTTSPTPTTTTCPSDQYWNGSSCVSSTPPPSSFLPSSPCPQNHSWNGNYCIVRKQSIAHFLAQTRTSSRQFIGAIGAIFGLK